jgi:hypothetical protein
MELRQSLWFLIESSTMFKRIKLLLFFFLLTSLTACLIPEKFTASFTVKPDGNYVYKYDGTATHLMAASAIKQKGSLSANEETAFKAEAEKASKSDGVRKASYLGGGRYELSLEKDLKIGQIFELMRIASVTKDKAGVFTIESAELKPKDKQGLSELGIKISGTMNVRLPSNAQVISHNADSTPGLISKDYSWKIGGVDQKPVIKFKLN